MAASKKTGQYEAMFLFPASAASEVDASIKTARGIIERHGGQIIVIKKWDERKLAYELKKQKRGLFVVAFFTAPGSTVAAIERDVQLSEDILRVLVTRADHLNADEMAKVEPQPIIPREPSGFGEGGFAGGYGGGRGGRVGDRGDRPARAPEGEPAGAGKE
jgi:small subunit ribosomal protein S6